MEMIRMREAVRTLILSSVYWALPLRERLVLIKYLVAHYLGEAAATGEILC